MTLKTIEDFMSDFTPEMTAAVEARTAALIEEEMTLRDLRRAHSLTQVQMAKLLGMEQESISRLEGRADLLLSTLASYVAAMGGSLRLVAQFPDRNAVTIALGDLSESAPTKRRSRKRVAG